jgi:hypothetical protein
VRALPDHLGAGERVRALACAISSSLGSEGLVVVTDARLFFLEVLGFNRDDVEVAYRWAEVASIELRDDRLTLVRVHDPSEGTVARARRFLTDTPVRLEIEIGNRAERAGVYGALAGREGPLQDRALSFDEVPPLEQSVSPASARPPEPLTRVGRRMLVDDLRSGALPLLAAGWALALTAIALGSLGLKTERDCNTWHAASWVLPVMFACPPVAAVLMRAGRQRLRHDMFGGLAGFGFLVLVSFAVYGSAIWRWSGHCF